MVKSKAKSSYKCSRCGSECGEKTVCIIDGKPVCLGCLYGGAEPFEIYPIGVVRNGLRRAGEGFGTCGEEGVSRIELLGSQKPFMYKLDDEKYITVVYYLHETTSVRSVFNRGLDGKKVGVFASRTPHRPSKIAIQDVRLLKMDDTTLFVEGLDAVNGSPVLDIKMKWSPCPY